jgi:hypothetical protein
MALPKLNDVPKYELTIPSTGKTVIYRPYLVKEQKVLLIALESQDEKQILKAVVDTIDACIYDDIKIESLATFDIEYLFIQIRSKSAGETSKLSLKCFECEVANNVTIKLNDINIIIDKKTKEIQLTDKYTLVMKYPKYAGILLNIEREDGDQTMTTALFELIILCLDSLRSDDDNLMFDNESKAEIENFLDGLNTEQLEKIILFVNNLPKLQHDVHYKCTACNHDNKITLRGIQDFF